MLSFSLSLSQQQEQQQQLSPYLFVCFPVSLEVTEEHAMRHLSSSTKTNTFPKFPKNPNFPKKTNQYLAVKIIEEKRIRAYISNKEI